MRRFLLSAIDGVHHRGRGAGRHKSSDKVENSHDDFQGNNGDGCFFIAEAMELCHGDDGQEKLVDDKKIDASGQVGYHIESTA